MAKSKDKKSRESGDKTIKGSKKVEYGPVKTRSCTDVVFLLLFLVFICIWAGVAMFAFMNGNPLRAIYPSNSDGLTCGLDAKVKDKPYLFYFDLKECIGVSGTCSTPQVCVKECPSKNVDQANAAISDLICKKDVDINVEKNSDISDLIKNQSCSGFSLFIHEPRFLRCIPQEVMTFITNNTQPLPPLAKYVLNLEDVKEAGKHAVSDLMASWPYIICGLVQAMILCLVYLFLARLLLAPLIWSCAFGVIAALALGLILSIKKIGSASTYEEIKTELDESTELLESLKILSTTKGFWIFTSSTVGMILLIFILLAVFLRKRVQMATAVIGEASKAVHAAKSTLLFPLLVWILQAAFFALCIIVALYLYTTRGFNYTPLYHTLNLFCFFWTLYFINGFGRMILAGAFASWYWTMDKKDVKFFILVASIKRTIRYHLGTIAFGSLTIAICKTIRVLIQYAKGEMEKFLKFRIINSIFYACQCFFWCVEKFLKFFSNNAYVMCAIHGKNFCTSAKRAFNLLVQNCVRAIVLDKLTDFVLLLGKLLITSLLCFFWCEYFAHTFDGFLDVVKAPKLYMPILPTIIIGIGAYLTSTLFFYVYTIAIKTIFLCFLEDCEMNDGTPEKPYFMSRSLRKVFGVKNTKEHEDSK